MMDWLPTKWLEDWYGVLSVLLILNSASVWIVTSNKVVN